MLVRFGLCGQFESLGCCPVYSSLTRPKPDKSVGTVARQLCNCMCFAASLTPATETTLCASVTLPVLLYLNSWKCHFIKELTFLTYPCVPALLPTVSLEESDQREPFESVFVTQFSPLMDIVWNPSVISDCGFTGFSLVEDEDSCLHDGQRACELEGKAFIFVLLLARVSCSQTFVLVSILL